MVGHRDHVYNRFFALIQYTHVYIVYLLGGGFTMVYLWSFYVKCVQIFSRTHMWYRLDVTECVFFFDCVKKLWNAYLSTVLTNSKWTLNMWFQLYLIYFEWFRFDLGSSYFNMVTVVTSSDCPTVCQDGKLKPPLRDLVWLLPAADKFGRSELSWLGNDSGSNKPSSFVCE